MRKLLQIDSCLGVLSTGRISESIAKIAMSQGWECHIVHGARCIGPTIQQHYQSTTILGEYLHYAESLFDRHGLGSRRETKRIIEIIKRINPDIIQLHCIHGYYINYKLLFDYLNGTDIPIVWTFHDCWAFTGHCAHFVEANCNKWQYEGCSNCPLTRDYPKALIDNSKSNYALKKELFTSNQNLHIVTVSRWLREFTQKSFLRGKDTYVINNGVDTFMFRPYRSNSSAKFKILGVASAWSKSKGLYDFYKLRDLLPMDQFEITLVGLSKEQISELPTGIKGIMRTSSIEELAQLYSESDVFVNPTYADSFPTVNMESLACGTPVITYRTGGSPEIVDEDTGFVIEQGDISSLKSAIMIMREKPLSSEKCRARAVEYYDKEKCFAAYIELYNSIIESKFELNK